MLDSYSIWNLDEPGNEKRMNMHKSTVSMFTKAISALDGELRVPSGCTPKLEERVRWLMQDLALYMHIRHDVGLLKAIVI